jgi:Chalcone isomerase-like
MEITAKMKSCFPFLRTLRRRQPVHSTFYFVAILISSGSSLTLAAGDRLQIQGEAERYHSLFHVENIVLYTPHKLSYRDILSAKYNCLIICNYLIHAPEAYYRSTWKSELAETGASDTSAEAFVTRLPKSVNSGDSLELKWAKASGLTISFNHQIFGTFNDATIFRAVFNTFLGPTAPPGMAAKLLGQPPGS